MPSSDSKSPDNRWEALNKVQTPDESSDFSQFKPEQNAVNRQSSLSEELNRKGYHPVMIFGTRATGKSSLLASLFYYLQSDPESPAIALQGEFVIPTDTSYGQSVADAASHFLNHVVNNFHDGISTATTQDEQPFFVPVVLRPNNGQPEVKLAFLESKGEWYAIQRDSKNLYPRLKTEVAEVYEKFPKGISILLIAPYVIGEAYSDQGKTEWAQQEMRDSDTALFGALQAYQMHRVQRNLDKYLFLLTKWDAHTQSIIEKDFIDPRHGVVSKLISERYPKSWTLFQNMQPTVVRCMQYCAGIMSGNVRVPIPQHLKPIMNRFPQRLWQWLYFNSSGGAELFVSPKSPPKHVNEATKASASKTSLVTLVRKLLG